MVTLGGLCLNIREKLEKWERDALSPYASFSDSSLGRDVLEEPCDIRGIYQRDRDRILHSKAFRRMNHKTQVFFSPEGDHYRTRLTHTLEVSQNARTIAKALRLNEDLTEAIALGHDLGHPPFGHTGERALSRLCAEGFSHTEQGVRVVEVLEKDGRGLNLTKEVRDGICNHQTASNPFTLEGKIVRISDKIAYVNADIDDAIRAGVLEEGDLPKAYTDVLGNGIIQRLNTIIHDVVTSSEGKADVVMSDEASWAMKGLRTFMFENVYMNAVVKSQEQKAENLIAYLFEYYMKRIEKLPREFLWIGEKRGEGRERIVCDYIACMTDRFAVSTFENLTIPKHWSGLDN